MSQENLSVVRRACEAYNTRDLTALRELYDPDLVMHHAPGWPEPGRSIGRDAVLRETEQLRDAWHGDTLEPISEFVEVAEHVVVRDVWHGMGRGPDAELQFSRVFTLRAGKITGIQVFWDHAQALKAVGLAE
jgi:ketosteroid isomerase-like protein